MISATAAAGKSFVKPNRAQSQDRRTIRAKYLELRALDVAQRVVRNASQRLCTRTLGEQRTARFRGSRTLVVSLQNPAQLSRSLPAFPACTTPAGSRYRSRMRRPTSGSRGSSLSPRKQAHSNKTFQTGFAHDRQMQRVKPSSN
jgi:hypothetical protein